MSMLNPADATAQEGNPNAAPAATPAPAPATPVNPTPIVADPTSSGLTPAQDDAQAAATLKAKEAEAAAAAAKTVQPPADPVNPNAYSDGSGVVQAQHTDSRVHSVESLMAEKGITNQQAMEIFGRAIQTQNFADVNVQKLTEVMGKATADVIMANLQSYNADMERQTQDNLQYGHKVCGGEQRFNEACAWMNSKLSDPQLGPEMAAIKNLAAAGGANTRLALEMLNTKFSASGQASPNLVRPDGSSGAPDLAPFKTNREYSEALKKAYYEGTPADVQAV